MTGLLVGAAAGFLGALGLGGGTVLMMWMSFFEQIAPAAAAGVNLLAFLGGGIGPAAVYARRRLVDWRRFGWAAGLGAGGVLGGWALSGALDGAWLTKGFACLLILLGLRELFRAAPAQASGRRKKRKAMVIRGEL